MLNAKSRVEPVPVSLGRAPVCPFDPALSPADPRYETHYHPLAGGHLPPASVGDRTGMDAPEHTRFRNLLAGKLTVRLDAMELQGPPADLFEVSAQPVPALMVCELLSVSYVDRDQFQSLADEELGGPALADGEAEELSLRTDPSQVHSLPVTWERG